MELGLILQVERSHINTPVIRVPATTEAGIEGPSFVLARPPRYGSGDKHKLEMLGVFLVQALIFLA